MVLYSLGVLDKSRIVYKKGNNYFLNYRKLLWYFMNIYIMGGLGDDNYF
jgi:hypothetical protein